jgi:hypothetical protein
MGALGAFGLFPGAMFNKMPFRLQFGREGTWINSNPLIDWVAGEVGPEGDCFQIEWGLSLVPFRPTLWPDEVRIAPYEPPNADYKDLAWRMFNDFVVGFTGMTYWVRKGEQDHQPPLLVGNYVFIEIVGYEVRYAFFQHPYIRVSGVLHHFTDGAPSVPPDNVVDASASTELSLTLFSVTGFTGTSKAFSVDTVPKDVIPPVVTISTIYGYKDIPIAEF